MQCSGIKSHEISTFKVNFLCQKTFELFQKKSLKNINLEPHFSKLHFLIISILKSLFGNTDIKKHLSTYYFFVKMKFVSTVVHIVLKYSGHAM